MFWFEGYEEQGKGIRGVVETVVEEDGVDDDEELEDIDDGDDVEQIDFTKLFGTSHLSFFK